MAGFGSTFQPVPGGLSGPTISYDPFASWRASPDAKNLFASSNRSKLAHKALMTAQAQQAEADNHLLDTASPDELSNLFGQPRNEREARLQQIVQGDVNARERGVALIPSWKTLQDYEHGRLTNQNLAGQVASNAMQRYFTPKEFGLKTDQFANQKQVQMDEEAHRLQQEQQAKNQLAAQIESNKLIEQHRQDQQGFQNQRALNQEFQNAQKNVQTGEMSAEDLIQAMPGLSPSQQAVLRAHDQMARSNSENAQKMAEEWNRRMQASIPKAIPAVPSPWYSVFPGKSAYNPSDEEIAAAQASVQQQFDRNAQARKQIMIDPQTGQFVPVHRAPTGGSSDGRYDPVPAWLRNPVTGATPIGSGGTESKMPELQSGPDFLNPINFNQDYGAGGTGYSASDAQSPVIRETIPVPLQRQNSYQNGRVYVVNGKNYRYENGTMVR